ncbi:MAG: preprotein translocase subunit YajC [Planctomycetes bacterium]|nr:preprotein translocase subunit YajC [Planctomycetota bacterium]
MLSQLLIKLALLAADATPATPPTPPQLPPEANLIQMLIMFGSLGLIFYLLIWRPESKRRKQQEQTLNAIKPKDKVVTVGGMYGTVVDVDKDDVTLLVDPKNNIKLRFRRRSIDVIESAPGEEKK